MHQYEQAIKTVEACKSQLSSPNNLDASKLVSSLNQILREFCPHSHELHILRTELLLHARKFASADACSSELLMMRPGAAPASLVPLMNHLRARAKFALGDFQATIQYEKIAIQSDPDNRQFLALFKKAKALADLKAQANDLFKAAKFDDAKQLYLKAIEILDQPAAPDSDEQQQSLITAVFDLNLAAVLQAQSKTEEALDRSNRALQKYPYYTKAFLRRGKSLMLLSRFEDAIAAFQQGLGSLNEDSYAAYSTSSTTTTETSEAAAMKEDLEAQLKQASLWLP